MKTKNYAICALAMSAFTVINCDDGNSAAADDGFVPSCNEATNERCLYAKVENASEYSDIVEVRLMAGDIVLARGNWVGDGFTIELPETINLNYLRTLDINDWPLRPEPATVRVRIDVSDSSVKTFMVHEIYGIDGDGNVVAFFRPYGVNEDGVDVDVYYTYVDSDVTISGSVRQFVWYMLPAGTILAPTYDDLVTYSIDWKNGWNVWWKSISYTFTVTEADWCPPNYTCVDRYPVTHSTDFVYGVKWRHEWPRFY